MLSIIPCIWAIGSTFQAGSLSLVRQPFSGAHKNDLLELNASSVRNEYFLMSSSHLAIVFFSSCYLYKPFCLMGFLVVLYAVYLLQQILTMERESVTQTMGRKTHHKILSSNNNSVILLCELNYQYLHITQFQVLRLSTSKNHHITTSNLIQFKSTLSLIIDLPMQNQISSSSLESIEGSVSLSSFSIWSGPQHSRALSSQIAFKEEVKVEASTKQSINLSYPPGSLEGEAQKYTIKPIQKRSQLNLPLKSKMKGKHRMETKRICFHKTTLRLFNKYFTRKYQNVALGDHYTRAWVGQTKKKLKSLIPKRTKLTVQKQSKLSPESLKYILSEQEYPRQLVEQGQISLRNRQEFFKMLTDYGFISQNLIGNGRINKANRVKYLRKAKVFLLRLRSKELGMNTTAHWTQPEYLVSQLEME